MKFLRAKMLSTLYSFYKLHVASRFKDCLTPVLLGIALLIYGFSHAQYNIPKKPKLQTSVYDEAQLLSASQNKSLEQKLLNYADSTSTQIVVAIISSTQGENINYLGAQWGQAWGIGQAKEDNGILILLAKDDRKIAINTGYGTEHLLTDALSKRIITRDIIPFFKQNNYYGGLNNGINSIFKVMSGEYKAKRKPIAQNDFPVGLIFLLIFIFIVILASISKNRRGGGGRNGGRRSNTTDILEAIILSGMGRGSYNRGSSSSWGSGGGSWSSGSSGGGFSGGFGGGGFGGGGASGSW